MGKTASTSARREHRPHLPAGIFSHFVGEALSRVVHREEFSPASREKRSVVLSGSPFTAMMQFAAYLPIFDARKKMAQREPRLWQLMFLLLRYRYGPGVNALVLAARKRSVAAQADAAERAWLSGTVVRIRRAARWVPGSRCLDQAITLLQCADTAGIHAELRLGVRRNEHGQITAHAWICLAGEPVGEDPDALRHLLPFDLSQGPGDVRFD